MRPLRFASTAVLALGATATASDLQFVQNPTNSHWYGISYGPMSWPDAEIVAEEAGGTLATISSADEQAWVQAALGSYSSWRYWIGLNDIANEGQFVWVNGEPVGYTNWIPGQPNNGGGVEDAGEIQPGSSWRWNDHDPSATTTTKPLAEVNGIPRVGWTLPTSVSVGAGPAFPSKGDLNGDGRTDLVVPNANTTTVTTLVGQASGSLGAAATWTVPSGPRSTAVGDFDNDGKLDWAVACTATRVSVRYGDGLGGFSAPLEIVLSGNGHGLAAADLNGDGLTDLAVTTVDSIDRLHVLLAGPTRTFQAAAVYATGSRPYHVTAGDLEGDGDVDLVVANEASDDISVFRNLGNGTFTSTALLARGDSPRRIALVDLNSDGLLDLAVPCANQDLVRVLYAEASGGFVMGQALTSGSQPIWTEAVDTNGDGHLDVVTASNGSFLVVVQEAYGNEIYANPSILTTNAGVVAVLGLDLNGDGRTDLVATGNATNSVVQLTKLSRDCNSNGRDDNVDILLGGSSDCNLNLEPDECDLVQGGPFDCDSNGIVDACEILADPALDLDSDGTLDECEVAGTNYCFGDGTGSACPCDPGQSGDLGSGCRNSAGRGGQLGAFGNPSVANDSVTLWASGLLNTTVGLFFQGTLQPFSGNGTILGDGLLCASGSVIRLEIRNTQAGVMRLGREVPGDAPLASKGNVPAIGGTRYYQVWYRDPMTFCSGATYNLTNGVRIVWTP